MQDRGLAAYITELVGTFFLVFFIACVVILYVATGAQAQFGSDFAVVGLVADRHVLARVEYEVSASETE